MFDYKSAFDSFCKDNGISLSLSFDMPEGFENANGSFDLTEKTVYVNAGMLETSPDYEKAFYLFHELHHAAQYLLPQYFNNIILSSLNYVIAFDGTCYKLIDGEYKSCRLDGGEDYFSDVYLGQPYEIDANTFAYEKAIELFGNIPELEVLYNFWIPKKNIPDETYKALYAKIDKMLGS